MTKKEYKRGMDEFLASDKIGGDESWLLRVYRKANRADGKKDVVSYETLLMAFKKALGEPTGDEVDPIVVTDDEVSDTEETTQEVEPASTNNGFSDDPDDPNYFAPREERGYWTAQGPADYKYFKSPAYKAMTRQEKMAVLWNELVPTYATDPESNEEEPMEYQWEKFTNLMEQKANGSFCGESDEISRGRIKTSHTQGLIA